MTRKHYIAAAAAIKAQIDIAEEVPKDADNECYERAMGKKDAAVAIAQDLARLFASDNPRFDRARFMTACGVLV